MDPKKLYFAAGLLAAGIPSAVLLTIPEAQAVDVPQHPVEVRWQVDAPTASAMNGLINNKYCKEVDSTLALLADTCTVARLGPRIPGGLCWVPIDSDDDDVLDTWEMYSYVNAPGALAVTPWD